MGGETKESPTSRDDIVIKNTPEVLPEYKFIYKDTEYDCTQYA